MHRAMLLDLQRESGVVSRRLLDGNRLNTSGIFRKATLTIVMASVAPVLRK